ncbi:hypothetical protein JKP88DRAFT_265381 [Tribonema minus]|uniref:RRM domain-containing protein n=1 Tax=Tribonema minus TaxID=303371 RepID=A0A835YLG8_9STRA|nr:hypothetical protein JKP88DRAFT_265381 [Tribonema minus]
MSDRSASVEREAPRERSASRSRSRSGSPAGRSPPPPRNRRSRSPSPAANGGGRDRSRSRDREQPKDDQPNNPGNNLYIGNLSFRTENKDLEHAFGPFGRVSRCEVVLDPYTKQSRGFGFVTYENVDDARTAAREMEGATIQGRKIKVEISRRAGGHARTPGEYRGPPGASAKYGSERDSRRGGAEEPASMMAPAAAAAAAAKMRTAASAARGTLPPWGPGASRESKPCWDSFASASTQRKDSSSSPGHLA